MCVYAGRRSFTGTAVHCACIVYQMHSLFTLAQKALVSYRRVHEKCTARTFVCWQKRKRKTIVNLLLYYFMILWLRQSCMNVCAVEYMGCVAFIATTDLLLLVRNECATWCARPGNGTHKELYVETHGEMECRSRKERFVSCFVIHISSLEDSLTDQSSSNTSKYWHSCARLPLGQTRMFLFSATARALHVQQQCNGCEEPGEVLVRL